LNLDLLRPEICLAVTAVVIIAVDLLCRHKWLVTVVSIAGLLASVGLALSLVGNTSNLNALSIGNGLFVLDRYAVYFKLLFAGITFLIILASVGYIQRLPKLHGEFHALILTATLGAMLTAAAHDIISILLSIELTAISLYALVAMLKNDKSSESAVKYILLGAVNSAVMLFGFALVFGFSGSTSLTGIAQAISGTQIGNVADNAGLLFGLVLILAGLAFKIAAVPFHMWTPDVYEGAPAPITLLLSTISKIAGFSILMRFMFVLFTQVNSPTNNFGVILAIISATTMIVGNLLAIRQQNIKRLLAYSSIAQSGYILMAIAAHATNAYSGIFFINYDQRISSFLYYLAVFAIAEVAVFTVIIIASQKTDVDNISDYAGLAKRSPTLACAMTLGLLSLMGLPPLAGFAGKVFIFSSVATQSNLIWLVIVAVLASVISAYYYLRIIRTIWMDAPASTDNIKFSLSPKLVLFIACSSILLIGILPTILMEITDFARIVIH